MHAAQRIKLPRGCLLDTDVAGHCVLLCCLWPCVIAQISPLRKACVLGRSELDQNHHFAWRFFSLSSVTLEHGSSNASMGLYQCGPPQTHIRSLSQGSLQAKNLAKRAKTQPFLFLQISRNFQMKSPKINILPSEFSQKCVFVRQTCRQIRHVVVIWPESEICS